MIRTCRMIAAVLVLSAASAQDRPRAATTDPNRSSRPPAATSRSFLFTYEAAYSAPPKDRDTFDMWVPLPSSDQNQKISELVIQSPLDGEVTTEPEYGNSNYHFRSGPRGGVPLLVLVRFRVERKEIRHADLKKTLATPPTPPAGLDRYLKSDRLVPVDDETKALAARIAKDKTSAADKARAIYDYVVGNIRHDTGGQGWGRGDLRFALTVRKGNSADLATAFTGLARAAGIPARFVAGFRIPDGRKEGYLGSYHAWAEFWLDGLGWIPVDPAAAVVDPGGRGAYFGSIDSNRVQISVGRDVVLNPPQNGDPINFWLYPYAEGNGQPLSGATYRFRHDEPPPQAPNPAPGGGPAAAAPRPGDPNRPPVPKR